MPETVRRRSSPPCAWALSPSTSPSDPTPPWVNVLRLGALLCFGVIVLLMAAWVLTDPSENLQTDWTAFDTTANRLFDGEAIYRPYEKGVEDLPYLYPPYALWLVVPLAPLGFYGSFFASLALSLGSTVAAVRLVGRLAPPDRLSTRTALVVAATTGATITSALIGQYSGLLALGVAASAYLTSRRRPFAAGAALALLLLKPYLLIVALPFIVWSRSWKMLQGALVASAAVLTSSLAFGFGRWAGFFGNAESMLDLQRENGVPWHKMVTLHAGLVKWVGLDGSEAPALFLWFVAASVLGVAVLRRWTPSAFVESPLWAFASLALFLVAGNLRLYFYDGLLVAIGALLYFVGGRPANERLRLLGWVSMAVAWLGLWGGVWLELNALTPLACVGLIAAMTGRTTAEGPSANRSDVLYGETPPVTIS